MLADNVSTNYGKTMANIGGSLLHITTRVTFFDIGG